MKKIKNNNKLKLPPIIFKYSYYRINFKKMLVKFIILKMGNIQKHL